MNKSIHVVLFCLAGIDFYLANFECWPASPNTIVRVGDGTIIDLEIERVFGRSSRFSNSFRFHFSTSLRMVVVNPYACSVVNPFF